MSYECSGQAPGTKCEGCLSAYMAGAKCQHQAATNVTPMRRAG